MIGADASLALVYVPAATRHAFAALFEVNAAMADVVRTTSEPMIGRIRLAWWREQLEALDSGGEAPADFTWNAAIELREPLGGEVLLWSRLETSRIAIRTPTRTSQRDGDSITAGFSAADVSLFDATTGDRL